MNNRVILSFASDKYIPFAERMSNVLLRYKGFDTKIWIDEYPPNSPDHKQQPYAFKAFAFKWAYEKGYKSALWLDSAVWPSKDPNAVFDEIEALSYWICLNGWSQGHWSTDEQLKYYDITRDDAFKISHAMACIIGIYFKSDGLKLYKEYLKAAQDGVFKGPWSNTNGEVSEDNRVLGSRHDQTCLGFIANKLSLTYKTHTAEYVDRNIPPKSDVPFYTCANQLKYEV